MTNRKIGQYAALGRSWHVIPRRDGWAVRKSGAFRASKVFDTRSDAIKYAKGRAQTDGTELYIHRRDGTVRERSSGRLIRAAIRL